MEPEELTPEEVQVSALLDEINKDPEPKGVTWDKGNSLISIDFGTAEYAVLMKYCMDDAGMLHIREILYGSEILQVDVTATKGILIEDKDARLFEKMYSVPRLESLRIQDTTRDKRGDYKFNYHHNQHPRSPRKRR